MNYRPQVSAASYEKTAFHPLRITSLTEQLRLLSQFQCRNILEIGVGKGLVKHFLSRFNGIKHTSLDIAADLAPDVVGSVLSMPFKDGEFDCVLCCQVLEHLRFEDFPAALSEVRRVTSCRVILSLPDKRRRAGIGLCLPRYGWRKAEWSFERRKAHKERLSTQHYWEIGHSRDTRGSNVVRHIVLAGFHVEAHYRLENFAWHSFFILKRPEMMAGGRS